jgi:hypothetical protein
MDSDYNGDYSEYYGGNKDVNADCYASDNNKNYVNVIITPTFISSTPLTYVNKVNICGFSESYHCKHSCEQKD